MPAGVSNLILLWTHFQTSLLALSLWDLILSIQPHLKLTSTQINRNPTRLPSDVQLVTAVDKYHEIYQNYRNVIVCSIRGEVSFASKLAGGGEKSLAGCNTPF